MNNIHPQENKANYPHRGEVWTVDLSRTAIGDMMQKIRPCVVVSEDYFNEHSQCVTIVPISHSLSFCRTHFSFDYGRLNGRVTAEQMRLVSKMQMGKCIGKMDEYDLADIDKCLLYHLFGDRVKMGENSIEICQSLSLCAG